MQQIIKKIDDLILQSETYKDKPSFLDSFTLLIREYLDLKNSPTTGDYLFNDDNLKIDKRFIAVCFIRILGISGDKHVKSILYQISKLVQNSLPDICQVVGITSKTETHEFEKTIIDFIHKKEKEFSENLTFDGEIGLIGGFQQSYRRFVNNNTNKTILSPFLNDIISKPSLDKLFLKITEYFDAGAEKKYEAYQKLREYLGDVISDADELDTKYSQFFIKEPFVNLLGAINKDFEKSPYNSPSDLKIEKSEKKYPFYCGAKNTISFYIIKDGAGYALNTSVKIIDYTSSEIKFEKVDLFIGDLKSTKTIVSFDYEILKSCDSVLIEIEYTWTVVDGTKKVLTELLELTGQEMNIDWAHVQLMEPYNLEPVESEVELIGRENILSRLKTMTMDKIGSSYIYGQRRVGKTSIVKTLLNSKASDSLLIIYIEAGDWNDAQNPFNSMDNLGRRICKKIQSAYPKFNSLPMPDFKGSFNSITEFLDQAIEIDKEFRALIILDEFDRISRELFERGDIGQSFLLTLRSISNRSQFGFILVGGEKLEFILSQWQEFNKFKPVRVDYFSKDEDWKDFTQLIKKPVQDILEISDNAIEFIYKKTSGNPYFTKKICIELYNLMISNRDIHVTEKEAEKATIIARNTSNIGATDFSHFWEDGIKGKVEKEEETSLKRRKILIIVANLLKGNKNPTKSNIVDYAMDYDLSKDEVDRYLVEFEQRKILQFNVESYSFFVNFFEEWLLDGGVDKIISSFEEEERLYLSKKQEDEASVKFAEIIEITKHWKVFKGREVSANNVHEWLDQFDDVFDRRLVFKILQGLKFYNDLEIREKLEDLYKLVKKQINTVGRSKVLQEGKRKREDILVTYLDDNPAKGGSYYTKLFVDSNNIYKDNSCVPNVIEKKVREMRNLNAVLILDDFLGSGTTMKENISKYKDDLIYITKERTIELIFGVITGFHEAKDKVERHLQKEGISAKVFIIDPLDETDMCFSNSSKIFTNSIERKRAEAICYKVGLSLDKKQPLGYSGCQTTIVFPISCPNNSLPILWKKTDKWSPLFERL